MLGGRDASVVYLIHDPRKTLVPTSSRPGRMITESKQESKRPPLTSICFSLPTPLRQAALARDWSFFGGNPSGKSPPPPEASHRAPGAHHLGMGEWGGWMNYY